MLYERGSGELWYYNEADSFVVSHYSRNGVHLGCVLGAFFFCLAMYPIDARLQAISGRDCARYAYFDDVCLLSDIVGTAWALAAAHVIYKKVGLSIGWGPGETELVLSPRLRS